MRCEVFRSQLQNISILNHPTGHAAGEAGAGLPAVRPQPRAPAAGVC